MSRILTLESKRQVAIEKAEGITALADEEGRDLTAAEEKDFNEAVALSKQLAASIKKAQEQDDALAPIRQSSRKTAADAPGRANLAHADDWTSGGRKTGTVPATPKGADHPFENLGEYALAVKSQDQRIRHLATPTTYAGEGAGSEGAYVLPPDFVEGIRMKVQGEMSLLPKTMQLPVTGNSIVIPKYNATPWGTTGVRAYWGTEGGLKTQSSPALESMTLRLNKVYALVPVTDELLEDAPALASFIEQIVGNALDFAITLGIVQGTGAGQPQGILNSPALITVAKTGSQVADTLVAQNVLDMHSRLNPAADPSSVVWLHSKSVEPFLNAMSMPGRDNTGAAVTGWGFPVYLPPNGLADRPLGNLMGYPVIPTQACNELGDLGDIILADLSQYATAVKNGGRPKQDISIHLWFDYDMTAFRFVIRMTGAGMWDSAVTPRDGSQTLSPFVTLAERA